MRFPGRGPVLGTPRLSALYSLSRQAAARASAPRPDQSGAERYDVAGGKAHPDHGGGLHRAHGVRIDVKGLRLRVGHRLDLRASRG